jgi:predicted secreted protein
MKATLTLAIAKITNVEEITVVKGQPFNLHLDLEGSTYTGLEWYTNNDNVLKLQVTEDRMQADIIADVVGTSNIVITAGDFKVAKTLKIIVVESIPVEADVLVVEAGEPVLK